MKSLQNIFSANIKENKNSDKIAEIINDLVFELSKKKIHRLKDSLHIQKRVGELFEFYTRALHGEDIRISSNIDAVISGLTRAVSYDKEEFLYKSLYEKEQLEKSIVKQKEDIRSSIVETYNIIEFHILKMDKDILQESLKALNDTKLRGVEMLGILRETTSEALLTTLEYAEDIEDTVFEIIKNITYQSINEGEFSKNRFLDVTKSILEISIEIADEDQGNAKELLSGAIYGAKEGLIKAVDKIKNDLKLAPEEMTDILEKDLRAIRKELFGIEDDFIKTLENSKEISNGISNEIITMLIASHFNSSISKTKRVVSETLESIAEKIEELKIRDNSFVKKAEKKLSELEKIASKKIDSIKDSEKTKSATAEAKRLGNHAWEIAKNAIKSVIKTTKDAINKDK